MSEYSEKQISPMPPWFTINSISFKTNTLFIAFSGATAELLNQNSSPAYSNKETELVLAVSSYMKNLKANLNCNFERVLE